MDDDNSSGPTLHATSMGLVAFNWCLAQIEMRGHHRPPLRARRIDNRRPQQLSIVLAVLSTLACRDGEPSRSDVTDAKKRRIEAPQRKLASRPGHIPDVLPPPSDAQLRGLQAGLEAIEEADADMRFVVALTGLMIASKGRIPERLAEDLIAYNEAPTRESTRALQRAFENSAWLFDEICGRSFDSVFAEAVSIRDRGETARHMWRECRLGRYSLLDGEQQYVEIFERTGPEPLLAYFVFGYLEQHGGAHPLEKQLLLELARGVPDNMPEPSDVEAWIRSH